MLYQTKLTKEDRVTLLVTREPVTETVMEAGGVAHQHSTCLTCWRSWVQHGRKRRGKGGERGGNEREREREREREEY
jgi:hypothetical protein